jgi:hypothetical protein
MEEVADRESERGGAEADENHAAPCFHQEPTLVSA